MSNELAVKIEGGLVKAETMGDALGFCKVICESQLAPRGLDTPQKVFLAIQYGKELGLSPMAALSTIAVINNRPTIYGKGLPAIVLASGLLEKFEEWTEGTGDNLTAKCLVKRKGLESVRTCEFSVQDAKRAQLWGKPGPWTQYPSQMLMYKARSRAFTLFSDVLAGMPVYEDYMDNPPERKEPKEVAVNDPLLASPVATEKVDAIEAASSADVAAETTGDAELYRGYLSQLEGVMDKVTLAKTCEWIKTDKPRLSVDQIADLRQKAEEKRDEFKRV